MAKRRGRRGKKAKPGLITKMRGAGYIASKALPAYWSYDISGGGKDGVINAAYNQIGMRPDGSFEPRIIKEQWGPLALWTVGDTILSKTGMYRRISKTVNSIFK